MAKKVINSLNAPAPVGPYNHSVLVNGMLFISGQIALDRITGKLVIDDIQSETHMVMKNLGSILKEAGMDFNHVVKCSVFVSDMENYGKINQVYSTYFKDESAPARELVEVANLPKYVNVEISCIAYKEDI